MTVMLQRVKTDSCTASQEIPRNLWNTKDHYRIIKTPALVSFLTHVKTVFVFSSGLFDIHINNILLYEYRLS
jgi:hypothetical protein